MTELQEWAVARNRAHKDALHLGAFWHTMAILAEMRREYELAQVYRREAAQVLEGVL